VCVFVCAYVCVAGTALPLPTFYVFLFICAALQFEKVFACRPRARLRGFGLARQHPVYFNHLLAKGRGRGRGLILACSVLAWPGKAAIVLFRVVASLACLSALYCKASIINI